MDHLTVGYVGQQKGKPPTKREVKIPERITNARTHEMVGRRGSKTGKSRSSKREMKCPEQRHHLFGVTEGKTVILNTEYRRRVVEASLS